MDSANREAILEGLNVFRALESWGAVLYAAWAQSESDPHLNAAHLIIAEREANHSRLLAERIRALNGEPGPACVDGVLAEQLAELRCVRGFISQLDALKAVTERDAERMAGCQAALARGFEAARASDPETHRFWSQLYSEERVSGGWYRQKYGELSGKRPRTEALPVLAAAQVERRAVTLAPTAEPAACAASA
jgi:hypothetical protein